MVNILLLRPNTQPTIRAIDPSTEPREWLNGEHVAWTQNIPIRRGLIVVALSADDQTLHDHTATISGMEFRGPCALVRRNPEGEFTSVLPFDIADYLLGSL